MKILTIQDVQAILKISRSKTYQLAKDGTLPFFRVDKSYRILEDDLYTWISNQSSTVSI
ncbi:helix-turn-helix domain-containing protein [Clostridium tertium]|uniref:helix-turn-helix domain-containing protein n=1 Tax=Clostridium tertium TaxID=1559 RepID=UPI00325AF4C1